MRDLDYVETDIIANIERFIPELAGFLVELQVRAVGLAAAQAAVEEAKKSGTLGVAKVEKKSVTKPISPRINQLTVPRIPEPERVENHFKANYLIPNSLNQNNLEMVQKHRDDVREKEREKLKKKYDNSHNFKFQDLTWGKQQQLSSPDNNDDGRITKNDNEETHQRVKEVTIFDTTIIHPPPTFSNPLTKVHYNTSSIYRDDYIRKKYGNNIGSSNNRTIDAVRREVEENKSKELAFNNTYVHPIPDYSKTPAKVRYNASAVYREDYLFRKQQAKDAIILKQYETELRDQTEFLIWQKEMKTKDKSDQLELIVKRKEQAKISNIECAEAIMKQKEDNHLAADVIRNEKEAIKLQKKIDNEKELLKNQIIAQKIIEEKEWGLKAAATKLVEDNHQRAKQVRAEIEDLRMEKQKQIQIEEERKMDIVRQLRAENDVHREIVKVFDPTEVKGDGFLDEMSYLEMKTRLKSEKDRLEREETLRRQRILDEKDKRAKDLEERSLTLVKVRQVKANKNQEMLIKRKENEIKMKEMHEKKLQDNAIILEKDLREVREKKRIDLANLKAAEYRVHRQQLYMGAAAGLVEETNEDQLVQAKERIAIQTQTFVKEEAKLLNDAMKHDRMNCQLYKKKEETMKLILMKNKELEAIEEKKRAAKKLRDEVISKRKMGLEAINQHQITRNVLIEHNPYAWKKSTGKLTSP